LPEFDDILAACTRMHLIAPGDQPVITPLTGGISSLIVRVDTARGSVCVKRALAQLKVAAHWLAPVERSSAEVAWLEIAARIAPDFVPCVIGVDTLTRAFAMNYLDPARYAIWKEQLRDGDVRAETAVAVAKKLAAIHSSTARRADLAQAFANDATFHAIRLEPYFLAAAEKHPDCAAHLIQVIDTTARTKLALVHGDVSPKNILVGSAGPVLLDAECACFGDPAFDVAFCLNHLLLKCLWRPQHAPAYLRCFAAMAATYLRAVDWEQAADFEARACRLLAAMLLARVDGKSPVEYLTEERQRDLVRRMAKHFLQAPALTLDGIRGTWADEVRK
jgi:aminoglycoside phosphotransferase (APT) family kinase protein